MIGKYQSGADSKTGNASICLKKDLIELAKGAIKNRHLKDQKSIIQANTFGLIQMAHNVPIIAAVSDLKAQMFNFKTKVYE
jgi:hypothetical protein